MVSRYAHERHGRGRHQRRAEITVSWESPAAAGDSDITGHDVQSAYMMADDMMSDWMDVDPAHMGMDMMYMDMGLMAETTYYYRVSAMNSVGMGEYSDGMAMATTMVTVVDAPPLGPASGLTATPNADGSVMLTWTTGTSATHHFVAGTDGAFDATGSQSMEVLRRPWRTHTVSADLLTSRYGVRLLRSRPIAGTRRWHRWPGKWAAEGWSNAATATAN